MQLKAVIHIPLLDMSGMKDESTCTRALKQNLFIQGGCIHYKCGMQGLLLTLLWVKHY